MLPKRDTVLYAEQHRDTAELLPNGKLRFTQSGMDFPAHADLKTLQTYACGKAYRRALARRKNEAYDFEQHEPYIVAHRHRDEKHFLYCTLTHSTLPRQKDAVVAHTSGKRFKRRREEARRKSKGTGARIAKRNESGDGDEREAGDAMRNGGAQDVLNGVVSSDEGSASGEFEMRDDVDAAADGLDEQEANAEAGCLSGQETADCMEVETTAVKGSPNGVQRSLSGTRTESSGRTPSSVKAREFASKKRRRPRTPVPKKVRQLRQRRKTADDGHE